jgi:impB/mucB/samB family
MLSSELSALRAQVHRRIAAGAHATHWHGHVHRASEGLVQDSRHRPQDLRVRQRLGQPAHGTANGAAQDACVDDGDDAAGFDGACPDGGDGSAAGAQAKEAAAHPWPLLLRTASAIAAEARRAIKGAAGYRTSAGIACNKLLAKMASGLHKPDDQTVLPPPVAASFVAPLPVRSLTGARSRTRAHAHTPVSNATLATEAAEKLQSSGQHSMFRNGVLITT